MGFMQGWGVEAERIARETQELKLVASPELLPLLVLRQVDCVGSVA